MSIRDRQRTALDAAPGQQVGGPAQRAGGQRFLRRDGPGPRRIRRHPGRRTCRWFAEAFSLSANDLSGHPPRVVSTGLPYLLLPVTAEALGRARQVNDLQEALDKLGAAFVYLLDVDGREGRTWDNLGLVEDVATGSAAGPVSYTHLDVYKRQVLQQISRLHRRRRPEYR